MTHDQIEFFQHRDEAQADCAEHVHYQLSGFKYTQADIDAEQRAWEESCRIGREYVAELERLEREKEAA